MAGGPAGPCCPRYRAARINPLRRAYRQLVPDRCRKDGPVRLAVPRPRSLVTGLRLCGDGGAYARRPPQVGEGSPPSLSRPVCRTNRRQAGFRQEFSVLSAADGACAIDVDDYIVSLAAIAEHAIGGDHAGDDRADFNSYG